MILATFPVMKGLPGGDRIFHIVFFVVVVSAIIPGASIISSSSWLSARGWGTE